MQSLNTFITLYGAVLVELFRDFLEIVGVIFLLLLLGLYVVTKIWPDLGDDL